jgi:hypothetical protein
MAMPSQAHVKIIRDSTILNHDDLNLSGLAHWFHSFAAATRKQCPNLDLRRHGSCGIVFGGAEMKSFPLMIFVLPLAIVLILAICCSRGTERKVAVVLILIIAVKVCDLFLHSLKLHPN